MKTHGPQARGRTRERFQRQRNRSEGIVVPFAVRSKLCAVARSAGRRMLRYWTSEVRFPTLGVAQCEYAPVAQ